MKKITLFVLPLVAFMLNSCLLTRIVTEATEPVVATSTTVYVPQQKAPVTTTTVKVTPTTSDISLYLDLRAVGAAFGQASTIQEFEMMLNSSQYMLTNLDLNRDGYVDYLRVMEAKEGYNHVFVIQAVLAANIYQDVATIVVERGSTYSTPYVQVIGHTYIYGRNYIIEPVYYREPPIFAHLRRPNYDPWHSPYVWGHFPSHYCTSAPIYLGHYQAYVTTYINNHRYCHDVHFVNNPHYTDYVRVSHSIVRQDYAQSNPQGAFVVRNAGKTNTRDISMVATTETGASSRTSSTGSSSRTAAPAATTAAPSRTATTTTTSSRTATTSSAASTRTAVTTSTRTTATAPSTSARNTSATTVSASATPSRTASTTTSSRTAKSTTPASTRTASTTVTSRVSSNGTTRTQTRTVSATGATTTTTRGATATSTRGAAATSTRSAATTSTRSAAATSTSSSTRGTSTRR